MYRSTDSSAPVLTGQSGALTALLQACLVNGYGSKAAAGWSNPFHGSAGQEVFRQGSSGMYLNVDDTGPGLGTFKECRCRGYETMTGYATGSGLFPTSAQAATGTFLRKSTTADGTARAWVLVADARTFYLFVLTGDTATLYMSFGFGDFYSYTAADAYKVAIFGRSIENGSSGLDGLNAMNSAVNQATTDYIVRSYTGLGAAIQGFRFGDVHLQWSFLGGGVGSSYVGPVPFPNPGTGGLHIAAVRLREGSTSTFTNYRGELRGFYHQVHAAASFGDGDTFTGVGDFAGRTFLLIKFSGGTSGTSAGVFCVETSDWASSP